MKRCQKVYGYLVWLRLSAALLLGGQLPGEAADALFPGTVAELIQSPLKPSDIEQPIRLEGVILESDSKEGTIQFLDTTASIKLQVGEAATTVNPGDRVRLEGKWRRTGSCPEVLQAHFNIIQDSQLQPRSIAIGQSIDARGHVPWVETEGTVRFVSQNGRRTCLELEREGLWMKVFVFGFNPNPDQFLNAEVKVRGFHEACFNFYGKKDAAILWVPRPEWVELSGFVEPNWQLPPLIPFAQLIHRKFSTEKKLVRVRGSVVRQEPGQSIVIDEEISDFDAFVSNDGTNWIAAGGKLSFSMAKSVYAGLVVTSHTNGIVSSAVFDHVSGGTSSWENVDIGSPAASGSAHCDGGTWTIKGNGTDIWGSTDQFHFVFQPMDGDGTLIAHLVSLENTDPWAKAGVMIRESLEPNARFVDLIVHAGRPSSWQHRFNPGEDCGSARVDLGAMPWLKLVRSRKRETLLVRNEQAERIPPGTRVEVRGIIDMEDGKSVLVKASCRVSNDQVVSPDFKTLTPVRQIRQLDWDALAYHDSVRLRGVITYDNGPRQSLFMQDSTAGIFVSRLKISDELFPGQYVEVEGALAPGGFGPMMSARKITVLGKGEWPQPVRCSWSHLMSGKEDGQWIEVEGVVRSVHERQLSLMTEGGEIQVIVYDAPLDTLNGWVDATLRVRGACATLFSPKGQIQGVQLMVPSLDAVQIERPAPMDLFDPPTHRIGNLMRFDLSDRFVHRTKVQGIVTYCGTGFLYIQDASGGGRVEGQKQFDANVGDSIQVVGFPESGGYSPVLKEAFLSKTDAKFTPSATDVTIAQIRTGAHDAALVRIKATLLAQRSDSAGQILDLEAEQRTFQAVLSKGKSLPVWAKGSQLEVTGVCAAESEKISQWNQLVSSFQILVGSPKDIVLLARPPVWTLQRTFILLGIVAGVLGVAIVWIRMLRRQVGLRTAELALANHELETFSFSVSHDLRAPLRAINGFSDALIEDWSDKMDPSTRKYLDRIQAATHHMGQLIDGLLNLARIMRVEIHRQKVSLSDMGAVIARELQETEPLRDVQFVIEPNLIAEGDPQLLQSVLRNLLGNAWKYTGKHPRAIIKVGAIQKGNETVFFVSDDGAGFDMSQSDRLFDSFQRLHRSSDFPGTGIGLATVHRIIQRHGGRIWAEGAIEKGATFYFTISSRKKGDIRK